MIATPGDLLTLKSGNEPYRFLVIGPLSDDKERRAREVERIANYRRVKTRASNRKRVK